MKLDLSDMWVGNVEVFEGIKTSTILFGDSRGIEITINNEQLEQLKEELGIK